ncbi:hypothetical protein Q0812_10210 [Brevundimonas sp. 2R-24]|uniref:Uncharacterized protein n=1 Tax=Peiella sedimenti TaxID=3061083 RepID=A0ABT8SML3_9CAUL|nr:hypothetical protein [Caulobacteraceae bacterium XZ-24]
MEWELAPPTWEAAAILLSGVLAVGAALYVGRRQVEIATRQIELQARLANLEALKIRASLYERRVEIEDATNDWLIATVMEGRPPRRFKRVHIDDPLGPEEAATARRFRDGVARSRHLFSSKIYDRLSALQRAGRELEKADREMWREIKQAERKGREPELATAQAKKDDALKAIDEFLANSAAIFGPELNLSEMID